ncbi:MAG: 2-dehydro-3-deoxy-D-gluconate 5-dehydrogenase KduD [Pyrinomonadaceae bacterium]|nr:2-dehydro-3-deoxy-D-gluconate 5-dehydrogenase KduD [Pyrinomonadaceae bacterium]
MLDKFKLDGKIALVTGTSTGLGASMALALAEAGADVCCHSRNAVDTVKLCESIESLGVRAFSVVGDLADKTAPKSIIESVVKEFGRIDILVNNAGMIRRSPIIDFTEEDWATVIEVNLSSVFRLTQEAGKLMVAQSSGKIINIASLLSFQGGVFVPAYTASKSAVAGLTKSCANEWAKHKVNVNAIAPGYIATNNTAALRNDETRNRQILERIPAERWGEPEDLSGATVFLASAASDYLHGHILTVDGGWMGR